MIRSYHKQYAMNRLAGPPLSNPFPMLTNSLLSSAMLERTIVPVRLIRGYLRSADRASDPNQLNMPGLQSSVGVVGRVHMATLDIAVFEVNSWACLVLGSFLFERTLVRYT